MAAQFSAAQVTCIEEGGVLTVAFGGAPVADGDPPYLLLSRTLAPNTQDLRLGQDCPYLELSEQSKAVYGGIDAVHLSPTHIFVALDERGKEAIGFSEISVTFSPLNEHERVEGALRRVLHVVRFSADAA